jgi:hypothetical protein
MLRGVVDRHVEHSLISGSKGFSLVDVVHNSSISSIAQLGESVEVCRSYCEYGSCIFHSSITSGEVERFLTAVEICSS